MKHTLYLANVPTVDSPLDVPKKNVKTQIAY